MGYGTNSPILGSRNDHNLDYQALVMMFVGCIGDHHPGCSIFDDCKCETISLEIESRYVWCIFTAYCKMESLWMRTKKSLKRRFDVRSPVGLLTSEAQGITRDILEKIVRENETWLDLGCGMKPFESSFENAQYIGIDVVQSGAGEEMKDADLYFDGIEIPFPDNFFNGILCTQVLEHAIDSDSLVRECYRVLKVNGTLVASVPFIYREHEQPFDFRRFTSFGLKRLLEENGFEDVTWTKYLSAFETKATLFCCQISNTCGAKNRWTYRLISYFVVAPTLNSARFLSRKSDKNRDLFSGLIAVGRKYE